MTISDAAKEFVDVSFWADECREYVKAYVIGKRWQTTPGGREAINIMMQAESDEETALYRLKEAIYDRTRRSMPCL
jgi:hypothetical protein